MNFRLVIRITMHNYQDPYIGGNWMITLTCCYIPLHIEIGFTTHDTRIAQKKEHKLSTNTECLRCLIYMKHVISQQLRAWKIMWSIVLFDIKEISRQQRR